MKNIIFESLNIQNFKKIDNLNIDFDNDVKIFGQNGTGKTTIADAITFVLFNKDLMGNSAQKAGFKKVDAEGNEIPNLNMVVTLKMRVDGEAVILERSQSENWVTKRGSNELTLQGNPQKLAINESNVKKSEFDAYINTIIDEDLFRLLTNPHYFMENVDRAKRRSMLLEFVGDKDAEIEAELKLLPAYAPLVNEWDTDLNKNKNFDVFAEWLNKKSKTDREELKAIPEKIQALQKAIGEAIDVSSLQTLIVGYNAEIDKIDAELNKPSAEVPEWINEFRAKGEKLRQEANEDKMNAYQKAVDAVSDKITARNEIKQTLAKQEALLILSNNSINDFTARIEKHKSDRQLLLENWKQENAKVYDPTNIKLVCDCCGQNLPESEIQENIANGEEKFNADKKIAIDLILEKGEIEKNKIAEFTEKLNAEKTIREATILEIETTKAQLEATEEVAMPSVVDTEYSIKLNAEADELALKVKEYQDGVVVADNSAIINQKNSYRMMIDDANRKIGQVEQQNIIKDQIAELEAKEKKLQEVKVHFEVLQNLADDFLADKNKAFESELSKHFTHIKWQLFEPQINCGYTQVCEPLYEGRNWTKQSQGEQIFTGIDIIKAFQNKLETKAPIIIDNRESLTLPIDVDVQLISMYANEAFDTLKVGN